MNPTTPFWKQPHIYITLLLMVPIYYVVWRVVGDDVKAFSETVKVMVITAIISTALGAVLGFWLGTSQSSMKKDEQASSLAAQLAPPSGAPPAVVATGPSGTPDEPVSVTVVPPANS